MAIKISQHIIDDDICRMLVLVWLLLINSGYLHTIICLLHNYTALIFGNLYHSGAVICIAVLDVHVHVTEAISGV